MGPHRRFAGSTDDFQIRFSEFRPIVCRTPLFAYALPTVQRILVPCKHLLVPRPCGTLLSYQRWLVRTVWAA
jgi:hypothetical protein